MISPNSFCGFLCKGHRYELRPPVSLQPFEQKCLKQFELLLWNCVVLQEVSWMIFANSFCGFILTRAIDTNLDPPFFCNPLSRNDSDDLLKRLSFFIRFWHDISQLILWSYLCKGRKYELWCAIPGHYNPLADMKKNWFINGWCRVKTQYHFFKNWFTTLSPETHIKTLGTNQTQKSSSGARIRNSTGNQFLVLRWTSQIGAWIFNCFLKGIGIN